MSRLPSLAPDALNAQQKQLFDALAGDPRRMKSRKPGTPLTGPFNALLYAPVVGGAVQDLGARIRFESSLPGHLRELTILMVAARWRANYEWFAHAPIAVREGLGEDVVAGVKEGRLADAAPEDVRTVYRFVSELLENRRVGDETYEAARATVGEPGLVELICVAGYYAIVSGLLNTFEVPVPEGAEPPFAD